MSQRSNMRERVRRARRLSWGVEERRKFMIREVLPLKGASVYRVRGMPTLVALRHHEHGLMAGSGDAFTLYEVFRSVDYQVPSAVAPLLASLAEDLRVIDVGANAGFFSLLTLHRYPRATITAFEPDPENAELLRSNLDRNGALRRSEVHEACAATTGGRLGFVAGQGSMSHIASSVDATVTVPAVDVLPYLARADLVKIDIEGAEWPILEDPRLPEISAKVIVLEYHSVGCSGENAREAASEVLAGCGYRIHHPQPDRFPPHGPFWGASVLWAYRD